MSTVRVRFAPSPTGFFHIGSARTALFNWLYARHTQGQFILRIEDTDASRNTQEALRVLLDGMKWLGLDWDEGPDAPGDCGLYFQSQRAPIYQQYLQQLRDAGRAYDHDGAVFFKLEGERYTEYDKHLGTEIEKVRTRPVIIDDAVRGRVERTEERDFPIFRSDGSPVFHFVNVVDDLAMRITHVIRGEDHLSNTSKHIELFKAFGATPPTYAHIPLIFKSSGPGKMSKRDQGALIEHYQRHHYLPAAVRNYIALLGWNPKDDKEILPLDELIQRFDFPGINKGNARFDERKLNYINGEYLRALPTGTFTWMAAPILRQAGLIDESTSEDYLQRVLALCQQKINALNDLPAYTHYFFTDDFPINEKDRAKVFKKGDPHARIRELLPALEQTNDFSEQNLETLVNQLAHQHGTKTGEYIHAARLATSGRSIGPSFYALLATLGKERVCKRLREFV